MTPERPLCKCHGEPMLWAKDRRPRYKGGGYWRCSVKAAAAKVAYDRSEAGRARGRRYNNSPAGIERDRAHRKSPQGSLTKQLLAMSRVRVPY